MTPTFHLAEDPWVDCLTTTEGIPCTVGLRELLRRAGELAIAECDPLVEAAIWRLLVGIGYAAGAYPADEAGYDEQIRRGPDVEAMIQYLDEQAGCFQLFDPDRPFGQDISLRRALGTASVRPAVYLDVTAAVDRALLADDRHLVGARPLSPVEALRALLVQNMWGFGGRSQGATEDLGGGKKANYAVPSPVNGRIVLCPAAPTVSQGLAWRLIPTAEPGEPMWTFPPAEQVGSLALDGEATGATWLSRRVLLVPHEHEPVVPGVVIARGLSYVDIKAIEGNTPAPGWSDVVTGPNTATAGQAVTSADDLIQIVANFQYARPGTFIAYAKTAAERLGHGVSLVAVSLVAGLRGQKKPECVRRVPLPAEILANPWAVLAADGIAELRRTALPGRPVALGVEDYEDWLREHSPTNPVPLLWNLHHRVLTHALGATSMYTEDGVDRWMRMTNTARKIEKRWADVMPDNGQPAQELDDEQFGELDDSLFVTSETPARPTVETDPAGVLVNRLCGYMLQSARNRGVMPALRKYALDPDPSNDMMVQVTRDTPTGHLTAATTVAALFACYHEGRQLSDGDKPLPRVARSFGSGTSRGPRNKYVKDVFVGVLQASPGQLLTVLRPLLRTAAKDVRSRPDWRALYHDILHWDDPTRRVRERWAMLFYRNNSVEEIDDLLQKGLAVR